MPNNNLVYFIVTIIIAHFLLGTGYLLYKIMTAPESQEQKDEKEE